MNNTHMQGGRKTKMYGRSAKASLKELRKEFEGREEELFDLIDAGFSEEEILSSRNIFSSRAPIKPYPNLHSKIDVSTDEKGSIKKYFIGIKNDREKIIKIVPTEPKFAYCESKGHVKLWMNIDTSLKEDLGDGKARWVNYITGIRPEERTVNLNSLTRDFTIDTFAASTLRHLAQPVYSTKLENCSDFTDYAKKNNLREQDYVLFVL